MICPRCGSENVNVQMVTDTSLKSGHGAIWWVLIGWWWVPLKWFCFFWLALILKLFGSKNYRLQSKSHAECVCQSCGHHWIASESDTFAPATQPSVATTTPPVAPAPARVKELPEIQESKNVSYVRAWIFVALSCAALLVEWVAIVTNLLPSAADLPFALPPVAVFAGMGAAIVFGVLACVFAEHAD